MSEAPKRPREYKELTEKFLGVIHSEPPDVVLFNKLWEENGRPKLDFTRQIFSNHKLDGINLPGFNLEGSELQRASLKDANLERVILKKANLEKADLSRANLKEADLSKAFAPFSHLKGAFLDHAKLAGTELSAANLDRTNLEYADLSGANLSNATLRNSSLKGAMLDSTKLRGANITDASELPISEDAARERGAILYEVPGKEILPGKKRKQEAEVKPSTHLTSDAWTLEDMLGYRLIVHAVFTFLTHKDTRPPLCISIQSPWGGGKTSFMRMLQEELDPTQSDLTKGRESDPPKKEPIKEDIIETLTELEAPRAGQEAEYDISKPYYTVWFNAWRHHNSEEIWAGLAEAIVNQISEQLGSQKDKFLLDLQRQRIGPEKVKSLIKIYEAKTFIQNLKSHIEGYAVFMAISVASLSITALSNTPAVGYLGTLISIVGGAMLAAYDNYKSKKGHEIAEAQSILRELLDVPDYGKKITTEQQVEEDLTKLFRIIKRNSPKNEARIVIFIDDLDRCSPNRITEILEALNMFISSEFENSFFIVGMDPEFVSAALEESYSSIIHRLSPVNKTIGMGWNFLNKFIQLPVTLPRPDEKNIGLYIHSLLIDKRERQHNEVISEMEPLTNQLEPPSVAQPPKVLTKEKFIEDQNIAIKKMDEAKMTYSDQDPKVQEVIMEASKEFPNNPREMKRFLNILRFYYFIREGRKAAKVSYPSLDQIRRWIILVMKWPQVAVWLQKGIMNKDINPVKTKFEKLEKNLTQKPSSRDRKRPIDGEAALEDSILSQLKDENLSLFFKVENEIKSKQPDQALSAANETGLF